MGSSAIDNSYGFAIMIKPPRGGFKMKTNQKPLICLLISAILMASFSIFSFQASKTEAESGSQELIENTTEALLTIEGNSLLPLSDPAGPELKVVRKISVVVTAYSSTVWETDSSPYLTAAGTWVRDGIIANNYLAFGTKVRLPELYGDKIFVVEDRMSWKKGNYHIDIWFPSYGEAKEFGAKRTYIEVLES